ncbi:hypothetical protein GGF50DRAFT_67863, partial [Schizophyllum commune]
PPPMTPPTDNPFAARVKHLKPLATYSKPKGPHRFFYCSSPTSTSSRRDGSRPLPPGWRVSKYGVRLRPGEVDYFEEEDKEEEARQRKEEERLVRLAQAREQRARERDDGERRRILDENYPLLPAEGTQYWHAGLSDSERQDRLEKWRERYFNVVVRFRCDPELYDRYRHHYLPTEGLLDPVHDRAELDKLRRSPYVSFFLILRSFTSTARSALAHAMAPKSWVTGNKAIYIKNHQADFHATREKNRGDLYRRLARGMLALAGDRPFEWSYKTDDLVSAGDPSPSDVQKVMSTEGLDAEEVKRRKDIVAKIAGEISAYYRRKRDQANKKAINLERIALAQAGKAKNPVAIRITQFYSRLFYHERIKPAFERRWVAACHAWRARKETAALKGQTFDEKAPSAVAVRNRITNELWERESPQFKDNVIKRHAEERERQRDAARALLTNDVPTTPQEFNALYENAAFYLQPVANAIAVKFGAAVSILVCAPQPDDGGNIGLFSVHAGRTQGPLQAKWPRADPENFRQVEKFMIEFGQKVFSKYSRAMRMLPAVTTTTTTTSSNDVGNEDNTEDLVGDEDDLFRGEHDFFDDEDGPGNEKDDDEPEEDGESGAHAEKDRADLDFGGEDIDRTQDTSHADEATAEGDEAMDDIHEAGTQPNPRDSEPVDESTAAGAFMTPEPLFLHGLSSPAPPGTPSLADEDLQGDISSAAQPPAPTLLVDHAEIAQAEGASSSTQSNRSMPEPPSASTADTSTARARAPHPSASTAQNAHPTVIAQPSNEQPDPSRDVADEHDAWALEVSSDWSDHVAKVVMACRRGQAWGSAFADAVLAYHSYEETRGFRKDGGRKITNTALRPAVYQTWTKCARPYNRLMHLENIDAYRQQWWNWWTDLMPSMRRLPSGGLVPPVDLVKKVNGADQWEGLDEVCGKDGMLQFLLTLLWWGDAIHSQHPRSEKHHADWEAACADFAGTLNAIVATTTSTRVGK